MKRFAPLFTIFFPSLLIIGLIFSACDDSSTDNVDVTTTISGVIEDTDGNPVADAEVQAFDFENSLLDEDVSDEEGRFSLENIPDQLDKVKMKITHEDFPVFEGLLSEVVGQGERSKVRVTIQRDDDSCCGRIEILVRDKETEDPINDVEVRLNQGEKVLKKSFTSSDGKLVWKNICEGSYWLRFAKDGYAVVEKEFSIEKCDTAEFNILMEESSKENDSCCDGKIYVFPKDKDSGEIIKGAKVILWQDGQIVEKKYVEGDNVLFSDLCEGKYWIDIIAEGYEDIEFEVELGCDEVKEIVKQLEATSQKDSCCDGKIYVIPKDKETGKVLTGAMVKLRDKKGKVISEARVKGEYVVFEDLCEGKYEIVILMEGYSGVEIPVELGCNEEKEIVKEMEATSNKDSCCDGKIYVIPQDKETGEVIKGAKVILWKDGKEVARKYVEGNYVVFEDLCEGKYGIDIIAEGYKHVEFLVELGCDEEKEIHKKLESTSSKDSCCDGKIYVIPKDKDTGEIIRGAKVRLWQDGQLVAKKYVEGEYALFEGLCEGRYVVDILVEGYDDIEFVVELGCDEVKEIVKEMQSTGSKEDSCCDGKIYIIPKDKDTGKIIKGTKVILWKDGGIVEKKYVEREYVLFEDLCEGKYGIDIIAEGYEDIEFLVELGCDEVKEIIKQLEPTGGGNDTCYTAILKLLVKDAETYQHLEGAWVGIFLGDDLVEEGETSAEGVVAFDGLRAPATYTVVIEMDGYARKSFKITFKECKKIQETVKLQKE